MWRLVSTLLIVAGSESCGPTPQEMGQAVLLVQPILFVLGLAPVALLLRLHRVRPTWRARPALGLLAVLVVTAWVANPRGDPADLFVPALGLYGFSYAVVLLLAARLLAWLAPREAWRWSHLVPLLLFVPPAALLAAGAGASLDRDALEGAFFLLFVGPGCAFAGDALAGGWVPGALALLLLGEVVVRRRRAPPA